MEDVLVDIPTTTLIVSPCSREIWAPTPFPWMALWHVRAAFASCTKCDRYVHDLCWACTVFTPKTADIFFFKVILRPEKFDKMAYPFHKDTYPILLCITV